MVNKIFEIKNKNLYSEGRLFNIFNNKDFQVIKSIPIYYISGTYTITTENDSEDDSEIIETDLNKKIKEVYLNYDNLEYTNDEKVKYLNKGDEQILKKINNIIEQGKLPDIMNLPNGIININEIPKFNNILYYDENITFKNSLHRDSDYFEKITTGAYILCTKKDSLNLIKEEIINQNRRDDKIIFNLIISGSACEKIMNYIIQNNEFNKCIQNICIYCMYPEKYQYLKEKYPKIHDDIYNKRKDIENFINKYSKEDTNPFPLTKLITYEEYIEKYKERHIKVSSFYGDLNPLTYKRNFSDMEVLINDEFIKGELKQKNKEEVVKGFLTFDIKKDLKYLEDAEYSEDWENSEENDNLNEITINEYTKDTIYKDLNKWLLEPNMDYESIAYFTARLMYNLNSYAVKNNMFYNLNNKELYRGIKIPYSCLLPYERANGKIIILSSFTSTSENKKKSIKFFRKKRF